MGGLPSVPKNAEASKKNKLENRKSKTEGKNNYTPNPEINPVNHKRIKKSTSLVSSGQNLSNFKVKHRLPPIPSKPAETKKRLKALYDFESATAEELNFKTGAIMEILEDDGDWWLARNVCTSEQGYIPKNYFVRINTLDEFDWYHGTIDRKDADKLLHGRPEGTFLVRLSGTVEGCYTISVNDSQQAVRNYRIKKMDSGDLYLQSQKTFTELCSMIEYYKNNLGLCSLLKMACPKIAPVKNDLSRSTRDKWEIDRSLVELKEKIGSGNFGEVWKGVFNKKTLVAVKVMKQGSMQREAFLEESKVMKQLRHPKLVKLFAVCSTDPVYIITELMAKGCLQHFLKLDAGRTLNNANLIDFGAQIASGMQYIEAKNCVHRDLAARNILVSEHNMLKIGDFGLTRYLSDDIYVATVETKFPVRWTAPEVFQAKMFGIKSDVWAFGILMVEIFTFGEVPYPGLSNLEVQSKVTGTYRHPKPKNCSPEMYELLLTCWNKVPERRPTFDSLFNNLDDFAVANELAYV